MNPREWGLLACIVGIIVAIVICVNSGFAGIFFRAVNYGFNPPPVMPTPVPVEIQAAAPAVIDLNNDTTTRFTGYKLEFPPDIIDWKVTYSGITHSEGIGSQRVVWVEIVPTYWCAVDPGISIPAKPYYWRSCQPVLKPEN